MGCYPSPLIWRGKRYPAPPGQHYRGLPDWFQHGLPLADRATPPIPDTCAATAISPVGGVLIGGQAWPAVPVVGLHPCVCSAPITSVLLPGVQTLTPCVCAAAATSVLLPGVQTLAPCVCATPDTEVAVPIQSCLTQTLTSGSINDLVLASTVTAITKYDLTAVSGGSVITGIVPQSLASGPQWVEVVNVTKDPITVISASTSSAAGNRIQLPPVYGLAVTLQQWDTITLSHDPCGPSAQWVVQACTVDLDPSLATILAYIQSNYVPKLSHGESIMTADVTMNTGSPPTDLLLIELPGAGTYWIEADTSAQISTGSSGGPALGMHAYLRNVTSGAILADSPSKVWLIGSTPSDTSYGASAHVLGLVTVTAPATIALVGEIDVSTLLTTVVWFAGGLTRLWWTQLG
ncbi:MAG: hypothetical protein ACRDQ6_05510 [Pseudonocardiaceae bacterium]